MTKYTPMIEQYLSIKAGVQDAFLFFRLGDFYEMFFDDAILASRELEITLTGREGGAEERIPMCGIPYHAAENYIARLIEKGYKVAICEQVEDPSEAKGVVRREVVRIVTPGTLMDGKLLSDRLNNYIAGVVRQGERFGFTVCDLSTGELYVTELPGAYESLVDELATYTPSELIASPELLEQLQSGIHAAVRPAVLTGWDKQEEQLLEAQFSADAVRALPEQARAAIALLLSYLGETQKRALTHITNVHWYETNQYMTMDPFTRRNLELVETVRERSKKGSLLWLLDETVTAIGGRMLRRWIEKPLMNRERIEERLDAVDCLYNQLIVRDELRGLLKEVYDLERLVARISYGSANARDLHALKLSLAVVPAVRELCMSASSETLQRLGAQIDGCTDVRSWIEEAIVEDGPVSVRDGGMIKDGYDAHLDQLKEADRNGKQWIAELERRERERTGVKSLKIGYNKVFGYYIEVTRSNLGSLPEGLYERKQTLANAERFITPELKEKEALILEAQEKMVDIEYALFVQLRERIAGEIGRLQRLAERIAAADAFQSMATVSAANRFVRPQLSGGYGLQVEGGRHPVVEAVSKDGKFVANDTRLDKQDGSMLLITGPNMAGKSTYMRQVAMIGIMAQIGCFVPADHAVVPLIDRIFTRIGAADDLIGGQSTFMVEMMDIQVMTAKATERSLVIIDELGRGTSTGEGMAIAQAVIEFLHDRIGCKTLVSTHFHELAHLEESLPQLRNYCMAVKESGQQVTFLRKLIRGAASTSYGIYCARIAGLPDLIIDRAYDLLSGMETESGNMSAAADAGRDKAAVSGLQGSSEAALPNAGGLSERTDEHAAVRTAAPSSYEIKETAAALSETARQQTAAGYVQLSLFQEEKKAETPKRKTDEKAELIAEQIRTADLINMTPLAAMNLLYELKQRLQEK